MMSIMDNEGHDPNGFGNTPVPPVADAIIEIDEMIRLRATRSPSIAQMRRWKAEIEQLRSNQIWKLIADAPQDGTECWVITRAHGKPDGQRMIFRAYQMPVGTWRDVEDDEEIYPPTHFMVIYEPALPKE